jgi:hypothetical protein
MGGLIIIFNSTLISAVRVEEQQLLDLLYKDREGCWIEGRLFGALIVEQGCGGKPFD